MTFYIVFDTMYCDKTNHNTAKKTVKMDFLKRDAD